MSKTKYVSKSGFVTGLIIFAVIIALVGFITAGFTIFKPDEVVDRLSADVNSNNFYTAEACIVKSASLDNGIKITVDEKTGAITLDGEASEDKTIEVAEITLDEGEYTLTAIEGASKGKLYMTADVSGSVEYFDFTENDANVIEITEDDTVVTLELHIVNGNTYKGVKVLPVVVSGTTAQSFYE